MSRIEPPKPDVRISMFTKGVEHYVLCFNDRKSAGEALRMLGRWAGSQTGAGMEPPVTLTEAQFRRFVQTVYEEGFCDGKINGQYQDSDELWPLSKSKDYMERLIQIDCPTGEYP